MHMAAYHFDIYKVMKRKSSGKKRNIRKSVKISRTQNKTTINYSTLLYTTPFLMLFTLTVTIYFILALYCYYCTWALGLAVYGTPYK